jgi:branched-chain amino acid aminotransferase
MLDPTGAVATCNATNFFIIKNDEVWTSTGEYCLNGITRELVIEIARSHGMKAFEKPFSLTDVYSASEAFVTGTFGGLTPVTQIDGRMIADGKIGNTTMRLQGLYKEAVNAEVSK